MRNINSRALWFLLTLLAGFLIVKVTGEVVLNYGSYYPPNFGSEFLRGREGYFHGVYHWAFYTHIASGPFSLMLGMILVSDRLRRRLPVWHRRLGRVQVFCVLLLVVPSGLWMAYYAAAGSIASVGLAALAIATGFCVALGWRSAVNRRFPEHRRWMWRTFLLLCSAIVLRLIGGLATVTSFAYAWVDPLATWMSWLLPIAVFEFGVMRKRGLRRRSPASVRAT